VVLAIGCVAAVAIAIKIHCWEGQGSIGTADKPQKITFGEMRDTGARGVLIYCADHHCSHSIATSIGDDEHAHVRASRPPLPM
jgi:hypothetical protein